GGGLRVLAPPTERDPEGVVRFDVFFVETDGLIVSVDGVGPAPQLRVNVAEAVMGVAVRRVERHGLLESVCRLCQSAFEREPRAVAVINVCPPALLQDVRAGPHTARAGHT